MSAVLAVIENDRAPAVPDAHAIQSRRILEALVLAEEQMRNVSTYRGAYAVVRDVDVIRQMAKAMGVAEDVQREASEATARCLFILGRSLITAFPDLTAPTVAERTEIKPTVVAQALTIAQYDAEKLGEAFIEIKERDEMPTVGIVQRVLKGRAASGTYAAHQAVQRQRRASVAAPADSRLEPRARGRDMRPTAVLMLAGYLPGEIANVRGMTLQTARSEIADLVLYYGGHSDVDVVREALRRGDVSLDHAVRLAEMRGGNDKIDDALRQRVVAALDDEDGKHVG